MIIFNLKVNGSKLFKAFFTIISLLLIFLLVYVTFKIFYCSKNSVDTCSPKGDVFTIPAKNYTNVLKNVHENIDTYVGKKIYFTGYVYRIFDLNENQFILARNMIISSNFNYVVVGFLCESNEIKNYKDGAWVCVTGEITKGDYHGDMPIIKVTKITACDAPADEFVYPPDDNYIPTSSWL